LQGNNFLPTVFCFCTAQHTIQYFNKILLHLLFTLTIIGITALSLLLASIGYLKDDTLKKLGIATEFLAVSFVLFNITFFVMNFQNVNPKGLVERLGIYSFYIFILILSFVYTFSRCSPSTTEE
jgi:hypothetical protein